MPDDLESLKKNPTVLRLYAERVKLQKDGREYLGCCPMHKDRTPSFRVSLHDGVLVWKCFGQCNRGGNIFQFIEKVDGIPFNAAVKKVREFVDQSWEGQKGKVDATFKPFGEAEAKTVTVPLAKWYELEKNLECSQAARDWLKKERGITYDTAKKLRLGFLQNVGKLASNGIADLSAAGWIAFPCILGQQVASIKFRSITKKAFVRQPGMATALFNSETIDELEDLCVTEGEFDALTLEQAGFRAVSIPSASMKISPEMKDELLRADRVILAGDGDVAGAAAMDKLWAELSGTSGKPRVFRLHWPDGLKDANEVFLTKAKGDTSVFRTLVEELVNTAASQPMPGIYSLQESMNSSDRTKMSDHPLRLRFPWPSVDKMAILLPGSVTNVFATQTKSGKTCWCMNFTIEAARKYNEVVLNYQCELSRDEFANIVAAYTLKKNRNALDKSDYRTAAKLLGPMQYYVGYNPSLNRVDPVLDLIEAGIKRLGATLVVLDHIHYICRNEANQVQAQENASQRIKNMARKYGVKFVVVGQPRKTDQKGKGRVVGVSDWKGSETGGSDADVIFALHRALNRPDPNNPPKDALESKTEVHVLGGRSLGDGKAYTELEFNGELATFMELAPYTEGTVNA